MASRQYPVIAREGWGPLAVFFSIAVLLTLGVGAVNAAPAWILFGAALFFFRDPHRVPPSLPLAIVSPIHGRVDAVVEDRDPWLKRPALVLEIRGGLFDVRSIYSPTEGKLMEQWRQSAHANEAGRERDYLLDQNRRRRRHRARTASCTMARADQLAL